MSRISLHRPRHNRAVWDRPATDTRLLPTPSSYSPPCDGRSIDSLRHTLTQGHSRVGAPFRRRSGPATHVGEGPWPDNVASPEAIAPRVYSTVACPGEAFAPGVGSEDALPLLQLAERLWDLFPLPDSPVVPLGDPLSPNGGCESALPSLRLVERVLCMDIPCADMPHTEIPSGLVQTFKGFRGGLGPMYSPLSLSHGPSIASPLSTFPVYFVISAEAELAPAKAGESIPGRAGCPLLGAYPPHPLSPPCLLPLLGRPACRPGCGRPEWGVHTPPSPTERPKGTPFFPNNQSSCLKPKFNQKALNFRQAQSLAENTALCYNYFGRGFVLILILPTVP